MSGTFRIEPLSVGHDRSNFRCGVDPLDHYFKSQVGQDVKRRIASCFVAIAIGSDLIAGFYTVSTASIPLTDLPDSFRRKLPKYPSVPAIRIGRLAVDQKFQGYGLGMALLFDVFKRALHLEISAYCLVVDAKDDAAKRFYERFEFISTTTADRTLVLPIESVRSLIP